MTRYVKRLVPFYGPNGDCSWELVDVIFHESVPRRLRGPRRAFDENRSHANSWFVRTMP